MQNENIKTREEKWQKKWRDAKCFVPLNDGTKPKHYTLFEFPFPSGSGLHGGHMLHYSGMDVMARFRWQKGFDVMYPLGLDSMGIAVERYATKIGKHPSVVVKELVEKFTREATGMGWAFNPDAVISSSDPKFVKWTQWMFIRLFNAGLAYKSELPMNWCPNCRTSFTNEELVDGKCDRCGGIIEKKMKMQWNLAITKYADRLVDDLKLVDYPERVRVAQENWVGRSYGAELDLMVGSDKMTVYTTRIDTVFGTTFCVIAPEHKLVQKWIDDGKIENAEEISAYIAAAKAKDEFERTDATREKTGVELKGVRARNPYNGEEIPIFAADYVLADYGFGAIIGVPAHDQRDWDFAKKFGLKIIPVLDNGDVSECAQAGDGLHINSEYLNGLNKQDAIKVALEHGDGFARAAKQYKMRDWGFSRQMYWGEPIPLVYCEKCGWVPVSDDQLPLLQPYMDNFRPTENGESPLARATDWVNTTCPKCGGHATRETDTMPGWAGSSLYFLRFLDPDNDNEFCSRAQMDKWMPIDHYNGPMEHVTRHMMYSRFWYKALYDLGLVPGVEPYAKRTTNGLLMGNDGKKMSKSTGNGFLVSEKIAEVGADAARVTVLSLGPWDANVIWSEGTLAGAQRFLKRVENMAVADKSPDTEQERLMNQLVKDVSDRIENMQFNTAISAMMEYINQFVGEMPRVCYEALLQCLNPFAPHLSEEMWEKMGHSEMLVFHPWPIADESKLARTSQNISVSVNGKHRGTVQVSVTATENEISDAAKIVAEKFLTGDIVKTIFVPGKMINFVIKG